MKIQIRYVFTFFLAMFSFNKAQEVPNEFFIFKKNKIERKFEGIFKLTTLGPIRFNNLLNYKPGNDSLKIKTRFGFLNHTKNTLNNTAYYGFGHISFKRYYYAYVYARIINNYNNLFSRYTGKERYYGRSGETDISGIGYQNDWIIFQWGRGRQDWSAGENIQLVLSENSPSYDYGMIGLNFGSIKTRYFHGYLERINDYNRYITGRAIEWSNNRYFVLSISEIIIYSGENRPFDIAYLNPISTHLEIEMNERQNEGGFNSGNGVWQVSADIILPFDLRLSSNFLYDEYTIDKDHSQEKGQGDSKAFSIRAEYPVSKKSQKGGEGYSKNENYSKSVNGIFSKSDLFFYVDYIMVGTHTLRHMQGYNNFVQRGYPLGWFNGSDGEQIRLGFNLSINNLFFVSNIGAKRLGERRITDRPYEPYYNFSIINFPSGEVLDSKFLNFNLEWWWKKNLSIGAGYEWFSNKEIGENYFFLSFDFYLPTNLYL